MTRIASLTGFAIGTDLFPPQPDNPTGFWEHAGLSRLNDEILGQLDRSWDRLAPLPDQWWLRPELREPKQAIREIIQTDFADEANFVIKDPRLCLLVPLWREVLNEIGCEVEFLIVVRDVRAVTASLGKRNAFAPWQSELLWLRYNLAIESETREDRRALVRYEDLLRDWRGALGKAASNIALQLPDPDTERANAIDAFVSPLMDHAELDAPDHSPEISPWSSALMEALSRPGALEDSDSRAVFDRVRHEFLAADPLFAPQDQHWRSEFLRLKRESDASEERMQAAIRERDEIREAAASDLRTSALEVEWQRRVEIIGDQTEANRLATAQLVDYQDLTRQLAERIELLEVRARERSDEQWERLATERDQLLDRERSHDVVRRELELGASAAAERERLLREQLRSESDQLEAARSELMIAREAATGDLAEADQRLADFEQRLAHTQAELDATRLDLDAHSHVMSNMLNSRSWRITAPLRGLTSLSKRNRLDASDPGLRHPVAWHELLPDRPFRQLFESHVRELAGLSIVFFAYARANTSSVRVRLFEKRRFRRKAVLLEEAVLTGDDIRDGEASVISFKSRIREADSKRFLIEIESIDGRPGATVTVALGQVSYPGKILSRDRRGETRTRGLLVLELIQGDVAPRKAFAFVSGCPGGAYRYRCEHQAEMLRLRGYGVDVYPADVFPWPKLLESYEVVIAHRVPHTTDFEAFVENARNQGVHVVFDTDDLVFAPEIAGQIAALDDLSKAERDLWLDGVQRYRHSLSLCRHALVSTAGLKRSLESRMEIDVAILRNRVTDEMVAQAEGARSSHRKRDSSIRIGYMSGTPTHRRDFAVCVPALRVVMERHPRVRLMLVGHIEIPDELAIFSNRIDRVPLVRWQALPDLYADMDISLAPLESDNEFTEGKSELKYIEAGLVGIPTVANPVGGFVDAVQSGVNGMLCETDDEWTAALELLVEDASLRDRIGQTAKRDVYDQYTTRGAAEETIDTLLGLLGSRNENARTLRIAMVLRAPIANTGGGYKKIFHLIEHLSSRGHDVAVYVEPIAHLEGRSEAYIEAFCREHFECGNARILVGHDSIADCDVAVATNWPTANVVSDLPNARLRTYFIQDNEAEFYSEKDPLRRAAAETYNLPLLIISIGAYLSRLMGERNRLTYPHIDFALGDEFFAERELVADKLDKADRQEAASLLFFARPGIPRRAFDLGVRALTDFHRARPEIDIRLYGLEEAVALPFEYTDLGVIDQDQVADEMRRASVHLSFSRTNASTVIFEAMACGAVAVELDVESVRTLIDDPGTCVLCDDSPEAVTQSLIDLFDDPERMQRIARAGFQSVSSFTVANMCHQFEEILLRYSLSERHSGRIQASG